MARVIRSFVIFGCVFAVHFLSEQQVLCTQGLTRNLQLGVADANFVGHLFHYLSVSQVGSGLVNQLIDCAAGCLRVVSCFSFNLAAYPDIDGRMFCEFLASDKYNWSDKFQQSQDFHHYSIDNPCSNSPCANGGTCVALYHHYDFKCTCLQGFMGKKCEMAENPSSFDLIFAEETTKNFILHNGLAVSIAFTVCYRVKTTEPSNGRHVFSYASSLSSNAILLTPSSGAMDLVIDDRLASESFPATEDGFWHHVCATWENVNGEYKLYRDGVLQGGDVGLKKGHVIDSAGILVIGQEQDAFGSSFEANQCYMGNLTDLNVWDRVLSPAQISTMSNSCHGFAGNAKKWVDFRDGIQGSIQVLSPSTCEP